MKNLLIALLFFLVRMQVNAQYPKLIIQFTDKGNNSYQLNNPSQYLSLRSVERRKRYTIPIDSSDLPITASYVDSVRSAGNVSVLSHSKWLNEVLIETTDQQALNKIQHFPFVKMVKGIGNKAIDKNHRDKFAPVDSTKHFNEVSRTTENLSNIYNYGNNYPQVHIHEGEFLHNKGFHGETIQIAVLDAGFQHYKEITAFDSLRLNRQVLGERDFVAFDNSVNEDDAHGMYCLSILSANWPGKMIGTAPKASYWLLRTENSATEFPIEEHNWVVAAEFADSAGVDLISTSLGYNTFDDPAFNHTYNDFYKNNTPISQGAALAAKKGMIVSASAGNDGANAWKYISFPADTDSVCTVGAVNPAGDIAAFSSYGYPGKVKPNIVSVGVSTVIAGLNNQPSAGNGTSFSNPNVAGLIACLWQAFPAFSNRQILQAVYESADRYAVPDNRYGYGIPNFRIAYHLLKHDQNTGLYGNEWLFATPSPFSTEIKVKLIGRISGAAVLSLMNAGGEVISTIPIETETEEVYDRTFSNLANLPAGFYSLRYTDSSMTRNIPLQKGNIFDKDWLVALPNPFTNDVTVFLHAQEAGEINLRLIDTKGSVVETRKEQISLNQTTTIHFTNVQNLSAGVYFLQYIGKTQKRTIRLFKG